MDDFEQYTEIFNHLNHVFQLFTPPPQKKVFTLHPSKRFVVVMVHCSMDARKKSKLIGCVIIIIIINSAASEVYLNGTLQ